MTPTEYEEFLKHSEDQLYLTRYPDVAAAVSKGIYKTGREHYEAYGKAENRYWSSLFLHQRKTPLAGKKHGIFITTHVAQTARTTLTQRLTETLRTLRATNYPGDIWVIDDGSTHPDQLRNLDALPPNIKVVRHLKRGGISRAKNTSINLFRENNYDFGFLSDDDNHFSFGWWEAYINAYEQTGIQHMCWTFPQFAKERLNTLGYPETHKMLCKTTDLAGILLTITPEIIEKVGGFKVLPSPWGYEHIDYTQRIVKAGIIPFTTDLFESSRYVKPNIFANYSTSPVEEHILGFHQNTLAASRVDKIYIQPEGGSL